MFHWFPENQRKQTDSVQKVRPLDELITDTHLFGTLDNFCYPRKTSETSCVQFNLINFVITCFVHETN